MTNKTNLDLDLDAAIEAVIDARISGIDSDLDTAKAALIAAKEAIDESRRISEQLFPIAKMTRSEAIAEWRRSKN